ncbi:MAG: DNA adenine methylase, partial [Ruminiclostridium sp.]|nr:DNA adenine methylase [Ruminiclostridium sp.]
MSKYIKKSLLITPVLKWAGGKRKLLQDIIKHIPDEFSVYYEPFLGGGAVFFSLQPSNAVVNDINDELINVYTAIRDNVEELIEDLKRHKNEKDYFYTIRAKDRDKDEYNKLSSIKKASRIIYLNKTCYNGLFRVNQQGEFNAPFGRYKNPNIVNEKVLRKASDFLNRGNITFKCGDFEEAIKGIKMDDFVYFDPPYNPVSDSANFTGYDRGGFGKAEQERLKNLCDKLNKKGAKFLLSNSATEFIIDLYKDYNITIVQASRAINSKG